MDFPPKYLPPVTVLVLSGRNAAAQRGRRFEACILHTQRLEDVFKAINVQRLAGDAAHQFAQRLKVNIAVNETGTGRDHRLLTHDHFHGRLVARPIRL